MMGVLQGGVFLYAREKSGKRDIRATHRCLLSPPHTTHTTVGFFFRPSADSSMSSFCLRFVFFFLLFGSLLGCVLSYLGLGSARQGKT